MWKYHRGKTWLFPGMRAAKFGPCWLPEEPPPSKLGRLMLGRFRKLDWGVATGVGASCVASVLAVFINEFAAVLCSAVFPLHTRDSLVRPHRHLHTTCLHAQGQLNCLLDPSTP